MQSFFDIDLEKNNFTTILYYKLSMYVGLLCGSVH